MGDSRSVGLGEGGDGFLEARAELGRGEDFGGGAPAQDPLLGFGERAEAEAEFEGAAGEVAHFLALVPLAFADALGDGGREADHDTVVAGAAHVDAALGVPTHLAATLRRKVVIAVAGAEAAPQAYRADLLWPTPPVPLKDHCAELGRQLGPREPASP